MTINNEFNLGDEVYLKTDIEQSRRIVTAITIRGIGLLYELSCGTVTSWNYSFEISEDKTY